MIVLSSAEAEFYDLLKCVCQTFGIVNFALGFGIEFFATVHIDASVAAAIARRRGLGTFRHIVVHWFGYRREPRRAISRQRKCFERRNRVDMFTKHFAIDEFNKHMKILTILVEKGRASKSLTINGVNISQEDDKWTHDDQCVIRMHCLPRRRFFSLSQVEGAPKLSLFTSIRVTHGVYCDLGEASIKQDNWTCGSSLHVDLGRVWIGRTVFMPKINNVTRFDVDDQNRFLNPAVSFVPSGLGDSPGG